MNRSSTVLQLNQLKNKIDDNFFKYEQSDSDSSKTSELKDIVEQKLHKSVSLKVLPNFGQFRPNAKSLNRI